jgi:hypothetical protein
MKYDNVTIKKQSLKLYESCIGKTEINNEGIEFMSLWTLERNVSYPAWVTSGRIWSISAPYTFQIFQQQSNLQKKEIRVPKTHLYVFLSAYDH